MIHKLVKESFNGPTSNGYEISHLDHNPLNNNLSNLNYKTIKDHKIYDISGINNGAAWVQDNIIQEIRNIYNNNVITDVKEIAIKFNIPYSTIWRWIHYKNR